MPVKLPDLNVKRQLARKLIESVISQFPILGGPYVALLNIAYQPEAEKRIAKWRADITKTVNELEKLASELVPEIKISNDASNLGLWLSMRSEQGRTDGVTFETIAVAFPDATKLELEDACGELEIEQLVTTSAAIGHKIRQVSPTNLLFEIFDPIGNGTNPRLDAAKLARFILENDDGVGAEEMLKHFGWPVRQFNPAISILCEMIGQGRKSAEIHPNFACRYVMPDSAERAKLRRYASKILGE